MPSRARFELAGEVTAPALFRQLEIRVQRLGNASACARLKDASFRGPAARTGHVAPAHHLAFGHRSYRPRHPRGRDAGHVRRAIRGTLRDVLSVLSESSAFWLTTSTLSPGSPSPWRRLTRPHPLARRTFPSTRLPARRVSWAPSGHVPKRRPGSHHERGT